jgi:hypothetical protein
MVEAGGIGECGTATSADEVDGNWRKDKRIAVDGSLNELR